MSGLTAMVLSIVTCGMVRADDFGDWTYRARLSFPGYTGSETLVNFPALIVVDWFDSASGNVTDMEGMFWRFHTFNQDVSGWDVSNVVTMEAMFSYAPVFNQDIGNWDVSKVVDMRAMFIQAYAFDQDISSWNVSNVGNFNSFLENTSLSTPSYNQLLIKWRRRALKPDLTFHASSSQYDLGSAKYARDYTQNTYNWTFIDGDPTGRNYEESPFILILR